MEAKYWNIIQERYPKLQDFAADIGASPSNVSHWRKGRPIPPHFCLKIKKRYPRIPLAQMNPDVYP